MTSVAPSAQGSEGGETGPRRGWRAFRRSYPFRTRSITPLCCNPVAPVKVFDEDITPQQINALSDTKAIKELALIMTHVEESDDEEDSD